MRFSANVNGFDVDAAFDDALVEGTLLPFLRRLTELRAGREGRLVAFLAAPPGAGKSVLAAFLQRLSESDGRLIGVQALGMDGFHLRRDALEGRTLLRDGVEVPLSRSKGAPETFDLEGLAGALRRARTERTLWPVYDRRIHDVADGGVPVTGEILLVEGNWLLLDEPGWRELACDRSLFIRAEEALLKPRLVERKERGGLSREAAEAFCEFSDLANVRRCLKNSKSADVTLLLDEAGLRAGA